MNTQAGIDYGMGRSNVDKENGVRYGVISMNSINLDCTEDFEHDYGKPACPECGLAVTESDDSTLFDNYEFADGELEDATVEHGNDVPAWFNHKDFTCMRCKRCFWSDSVYSDESLGWSYDDGDYQLADCLDNDIFVLKSPFYTFAQFCSPCVPGAGNLDNPIEDGAKTYCLGHDWFDDEKAPYPVYRVSDDAIVEAE